MWRRLTPISRCNTIFSHLLDIILLVPMYWVLYALPYSFTIPTTRIPLPFPLPNNTAQATTIIIVSLTYIFSSLQLRSSVPLLYRFSLPVLFIEVGIVTYELIYAVLRSLAHVGTEHILWRIHLSSILVAGLLLLYILRLHLEKQDNYAITLNKYTLLLLFSYTLLTFYQWQRGFYACTSGNSMDDCVTILHKALPFGAYVSLLIRRPSS